MFLNKEKIFKLNHQDIYSVTLKNDNNYELTFYNYGGYIHSIKIPYKLNSSKYEDIILGYHNYEDCIKSTSYFNSIIGRVSNRISNSSFMLNGNLYKLNNNEGKHHLHGGTSGFNKKIWKIKNIDQTKNEISCKLYYISSNLEEGYPGNLRCTTTYTLNNQNEFIIKYRAITDKKTIVNLTNHNYWNFHGHGDHYKNISNHNVKLFSDKICENNEVSIPTGKLIKVQNTHYDFLKETNITQDLLDAGGIDHNYDLGSEFKIKKIAIIYSNLTKMGVTYYSDQPGVQLYTGNMMNDQYLGKENRSYGTQFGLCLEPQFFPDAINNKNFISPIINASEQYESTILMKLNNNF